MKIFGIQFAPLNVPLHRRLQTLIVALWFFAFAFSAFLDIFITVYLICFTRYWWLMLLYLVWIYLDRETASKGGRPIKWVKNWMIWKYFKDYFPLGIDVVPGAEFDPKKNYLCCSVPHGILPVGAFYAFGLDSEKYRQIFPHHQARSATLTQHFIVPFFRELVLSVGGVCCSREGISYLLSKPEGGHVVLLIPGGVSESYLSKPGVYKVILKSRKGFVKLALKHGSPIVPAISFGETDLFGQVEGPILHQIQEKIRHYIGIAPLILKGRGIFQYSFGMIPHRRKVTTLSK